MARLLLPGTLKATRLARAHPPHLSLYVPSIAFTRVAGLGLFKGFIEYSNKHIASMQVVATRVGLPFFRT
ncbi:MAG: hypothetical protein ABWW69_03980 [Pyrodictiaceae archaeon]